jgi:histidine triad (HIT) family protein
MSEPSIFSRIISGEIPSHKIYEDDKTFAFLDISPAAPGHTLVIPKTEVEFVWDMSDDDYQAVMATAKKVARRIREVLQVPYVGEAVVGVDVAHAHVHVVPFTNAGELKQLFAPKVIEPDHAALAEMAKKLAF